MNVKVMCKICDTVWTVDDDFVAYAVCPICGQILNETQKKDKTCAIAKAIKRAIELEGKAIIKDGEKLFSIVSQLVPSKQEELDLLKTVCDSGVYGTFYRARKNKYEELTSSAIAVLVGKYQLTKRVANSCIGWLLAAIIEEDTPVKPKVEPIKEEMPAKRILKPAKNDFEIKDGVLIKYLGKDSLVIIPDNVIVVADNAFYDNKTITTVVFGERVESIGEKGFYGCSHITDIFVPISVKNIGRYCFEGCQVINIWYEGTDDLWEKVSKSWAFKNHAILERWDKTAKNHKVKNRNTDWKYGWRYLPYSLSYGLQSCGYSEFGFNSDGQLIYKNHSMAEAAVIAPQDITISCYKSRIFEKGGFYVYLKATNNLIWSLHFWNNKKMKELLYFFNSNGAKIKGDFNIY